MGPAAFPTPFPPPEWRSMSPRPVPLPAVLALAAVVAGSCQPPGAGERGEEESVTRDTAAATVSAVPGIAASNVYWYYQDLPAAWRFYTETMGFETVADHGFAKVLRVAPTSYLTLVDAARAMHDEDAARSVTLALVTREVDGWWRWLSERGVPTLGEYRREVGRPHDGFVAVDPEGYYLEVERFNAHEENRRLLPLLGGVEALGPAVGERPAELTVTATVLWLYYDELAPAQRFWEELLGVELLVDQGWAKVYPVSPSGFLGLVDGARGLHEAADGGAVSVSFLTRDLDAWHRRAREAGLELRTPAITEERTRVRMFVAYDPGGYLVEWDTFLPVPDNRRLLELLGPG